MSRRYTTRRICGNWCVWDNLLKEITISFGPDRQMAQNEAYEYNIGTNNGGKVVA